MEPLLEDLGPIDPAGIHWVIVGDESGGGLGEDGTLQLFGDEQSSATAAFEGTAPGPRNAGVRPDVSVR
jgi:hypothetical protein